MSSETIHQSITDADDVEEIHEPEIPVFEVFRSLLRHPAQIIMRWNWKAALIGAVVRGGFYFTVYKASRESWIATLTAVSVEFLFRFVTTGIFGAMVQSFRRASPAWLATVIVSITFPTLSHLVEFVTHYAQETFFTNLFAASANDARQRAFAISVLISVLSAMFNIFIMQHGVMLVGAGEETQSFASDLKRIPRLVAEFIIFLPAKICTFIRSGNFLTAFGIFAAFGLAVGAILGIFRAKWTWFYRPALGAWALLLFCIIVYAITKYFMRLQREKLQISEDPLAEE